MPNKTKLQASYSGEIIVEQEKARALKRQRQRAKQMERKRAEVWAAPFVGLAAMGLHRDKIPQSESTQVRKVVSHDIGGSRFRKRLQSLYTNFAASKCF